MTTKEWLSRYGILKAAAERTEAEIQRLRSQAESVTQHITDMPKGGEGRNKLEDAICAIDELEQELSVQILEGIAVRKEIVVAIDNMDNPVYRELLMRRYIDGDTWEQIAVKMNYTYRHTTRMHGRALLAIRCP